jgi:hypothetical protein
MEGGVLPGVWSCWPFLKSDYGTQHMKFMLLFYKDGRMRMSTSLSERSLHRSGHLELTFSISPTVISTGNLNEHDWDFIENVRQGQLSSIDPLADRIHLPSSVPDCLGSRLPSQTGFEQGEVRVWTGVGGDPQGTPTTAHCSPGTALMQLSSLL